MNALARSHCLVAIALLGSACARDAARHERASTEPALAVPLTPTLELLSHRIVATGLLNPRGIERLAESELLVAEAGTGDPESERSGSLSRLTDVNGDGDFDDAGERT